MRSAVGRAAVAAVIAAVAAGALAACTSAPAAHHAPSGPEARASRWSGFAPCPDARLQEYRCGTLTVPLDRSQPDGRRLLLPVLEAGDLGSRRTLLFLTGGPGQGGVDLAPAILPDLSLVSGSYRILLLDQRGTGADPLRCPQLQQQIGFSDLEVPTAHAVTRCAALLGPARARYATTATVADLDALRAALGLRRWSIDGVSYGTYVAQRYAAAHRNRVDRLVLDSIVPVEGFSATNVESFPDFAAVLRSVCKAEKCPSDPAYDLSAVVRKYHLGPQLLDVLSVMSVVQPSYGGLPALLRRARSGHPGPLRALLAAWEQGTRGPADELSQGLHASTLCLDLSFPWGSADTSVAGRARAAHRSVARLTARQLFPFDAQTARSNGEMVTCELWPRTRDPAVPVSRLSLRGVRALLLHGSRDLSTPLVWARRTHADIPGSRLIIVPGAGHSVQTGGPDWVRRQVAGFLLSG